MSLEDLTETKYIDSLVATNPVGGTDPKSEGDNHIRGIKNVLLLSFPGITGAVTSTHTELNLLDGVTSTTAELNILDGVTATAAELNYNDITTAGTAEASKALILDVSKGITGITSVTSTTLTGTTVNASTTLQIGGVSVTSTAAELNILDGVTSTAAELNILDGVTATAAELNILDGVTSTAAELNILDGVTSTAAELNKLDGFTGVVGDLNIVSGGAAAGVTATEFQYLNGVTSAIQTQLDAVATQTHGDGSYSSIGGTNSFDVDAVVTEDTWENIGPTGSGATNIWTALDSISGTPDWIEVEVALDITASGFGGDNMYLFAASNSVGSPAADGRSRTASLHIPFSSGGTTGKTTTISKIPVDSNQIFKVHWANSGSGTASVVITLRGYGTNS